ncbi:Selenocysteine lyase/Cysteine desulfurase [Chitinophaga sp. CF118]|uniref:aminotransferase class V-fold PLP-dependent enzyme n=1 Tax=Chitinophaga sp. CF118 TaxID=1884367 RepID=UPI0008E036A2|nr:aminotransferase class V-fold PLP-dependent enzyme [Chitinophaga sp. CF118]SFD77746.1 Selenocysteine lyase/Cysteine desulfurase [Chitinophaga sp. CF118]
MDIEQLRADTPGCKTKVHFNNAGSALMPAPVIHAIQDYITQESLTGGYELAALRAASNNRFYVAAGQLINTAAHNIAFTSSATNSFARALSCVPFEKDDVVIIANEDYSSNQLAFLSLQQRMGIRLLRAASLPEGGVDVTDMERLIRQHHPRLVSLTHVPTNSGLVQPIATIGKICRELDIPYLVDACQSVGQMPLDVEEIQCDFLCVTMRKFLRGPRGAGFLYVSDNILEKKWLPLYIDMYGAEWTGKDVFEPVRGAKRFQDWEQPYAFLAGSLAAVEYALQIGIPDIAARNKELCDKLRPALQELPGVRLLDKGAELSSIITLSVPSVNSDWLLDTLRRKNINTSVSTLSGAFIDFESKGVDWALRISPHYYNTNEECDILLEALKEILHKI